MNRSVRNSLVFFFCLIPLLAAADDQQKAHKILNKVTAMTADPSGKRAVSLAMSQSLSVTRAELVQRRQAMNIKYGDLFVAYQLVKTGAKIDDIAAKMKMGKTVWQAADEAHADWKQIASEAKKLSGKMDTNLLAHFANRKAQTELDRADGYDPSMDTIAADIDVSKQDIEDAQERYVFLRDHTNVGSGSNIDTSDERAAREARTDPTRNGGPTGPSNPPPANPGKN
jgi:hypothetical protein